MIDVIFLLLTFFMYSVIVMVRAHVLPVSLAPVAAGERTQASTVHGLTIDGQGRYYFDRELLTDLAVLDAKLAQLAADPEQPTLYLAVEAEGSVDRGPLLIDLISRAQAAGVQRFALVGPRPTGAGDMDRATQVDSGTSEGAADTAGGE